MQRADNRKFHYIYKITRDDGRYYIGMHSTDILEDEYFGSGKLITRSIKKHGKEKHSKEILEFLSTRKLLKDREKEILTEDIRSDINCMNIAPGGGGGFNNIEHQIKAQKAATQAAASRPRDARSTSAKKSRKTARELGIKPFGGKKAWVIKHHHSEESKKKISDSNRGKCIGEKNSQFGIKRFGINKDGVTRRVTLKEIDIYLSDGWTKGDKPKNAQTENNRIHEELEISSKRKKLSEWYKIYNDVGFEEFVKITNYQYSVQNLVRQFKKYVSEYVSHQGKKRNKINMVTSHYGNVPPS